MTSMHARVQFGIVALASLLVAATWFPVAARAADSIYWTNSSSGPAVSFVALDASTGGDVIGPGPSSRPSGVAIDPAAGRIYWANGIGPTIIRFANLDGSGAGVLNVSGATNGTEEQAPALDVAGGRIFWANAGGTISFAKLNGSGGGDLSITGAATVGNPTGVAIDPAAGRIYWSSYDGVTSAISSANLDGTGAVDLNATGATLHWPVGVALDPTAGRVYWANAAANKISFLNLNGTGGADLNTNGATVNGPEGVAVDPVAGRVYWANAGSNVLSYARLDGTGGGDIPTLAANVSSATHPALLFSPRPTGTPRISGGSRPGSALACSRGAWAPDLHASRLYRAPRSFGYAWSLDGVDIPGAHQSSLTAFAAGQYRCRVTARNHAGTATQTSQPHAVSAAAAAFGRDTKVTLSLAVGRIAARGPVSVRVANANDFAISGRLSGRATRKVRKRRVALKAKPFGLAAHSRRVVRLKLPTPLRRLLARRGKLTLRLTAELKDPAGNRRFVKRTLAPKLKAKRGKRRAA